MAAPAPGSAPASSGDAALALAAGPTIAAPRAAPAYDQPARIFLISLAVVLLSLALALVWAWRSAGQAHADAVQAQRAQQVLTALASLAAAINEAEASAEGTLASLPQAQSAAARQLTDLRTLLAGNAEQYSRVLALAPLLTRRFEALAAGEVPRRGAAPPGPQTATETRRLQDRIRAGLAELLQPAQAEHEAARQRSEAAARSAQWAALWPGALAWLLLAMAGWRLHRQHATVRDSRDGASAARHEHVLAAAALEQLLLAVPDALCVLDSEGRFMRANPGCEKLWGCPAADLVGRACIDRVMAEDQRRTEQAIKSAIAGAGQVQAWSNRCQRHDGAVISTAWRGVWSAQHQMLVCVARDLGEVQALRSQASDAGAALQAVNAELARVRGRADAAGRLNTEFIATLGQRMRPPPLAIGSMADILLQGLAGPVTREQQRELSNIRQHARAMQHLVSAGLDLASLEAGQTVLAHDALDLREIVIQAADAARLLAQDKGLKFDLQLADDLAYARGDAARVTQVLRELLDNAVRFTEAGSIKLLGELPEPGRARITVVDTGIGISAEDQAGLFEPFHQVADYLARSQAGSGLGLAVCRRLARLMGGDITVTSAPQQGSRFALTLPTD